jgi:parallel beta-helix repeat protein
MISSPFKIKNLLILSLCTLFYLIVAVTVHAATYYVATTGNDASPGTLSQPFRTIARGVSSLSAGDTLYIRGGLWTEQIDMSAKTGTPGNYITVAAYPGEIVTIQSSAYPFAIKGSYSASNAYFIFDGLILDGVNAGDQYMFTISNGSHDFILRNLVIKNWFGNGLLIGGDNIKIINCKIYNLKTTQDAPGYRYYGIYFHHGSGGLIEGNDIYNNPGGGIQIYPGPTSNLTVRNNLIHDNNTMTTSPIGGIIVGQNSGTGLRIYNNLIYKNGSAPVHGTSPGIEMQFGSSGAKLWNNTIYGNAGWGITISTADAVNNEVRNNIVYGNGAGQIYDVGAGTVKDRNLTTNPSFVNAAAFDFRLQSSSPAIDAGVILSEISMDFRKNPRPQGLTYDIGAYEGGTESTSLSPPRNLRVQ